ITSNVATQTPLTRFAVWDPLKIFRFVTNPMYAFSGDSRLIGAASSLNNLTISLPNRARRKEQQFWETRHVGNVEI
ncbi:MAG TPA: hypothetical protein PKD54_06775, partial [Pirellulaceae bacterium]|nr:hypothetical protein [Pirellulaceae bacterium]